MKVKPYTLLSYKRLSFLYEAAIYLNTEKINGDFVECGSWNGGSGGIIASLAGKRKTWLFDSWEGMPNAGEHDIKLKKKNIFGERGMAISSFEKASNLLFGRLRLDPNNVLLVRGWFEETVLSVVSKINQISLLHLDCDWYESVKFCLENFYTKVISGGYVVIDDYGSWAGCRKAVDEFIREKELGVRLIKIDKDAVYFVKQ